MQRHTKSLLLIVALPVTSVSCGSMQEVDAQARVARDSLAGLLYPTSTVRATFEGELATIATATNQPKAGAVAATPESTPAALIPAKATPEPAAVVTARAEQGAVSTPAALTSLVESAKASISNAFR